MRTCLRAPEESRGFYLTAAAGVGRLGDSAAAFPGAFASVCARLAPGIPEEPARIKILKF